MQLAPRYGTDPVITLDGDPSAVLAPTVRQRRRLAAAVSALTDEQWSAPSRCDGWSSRDVIVHVDSVNVFWTASLQAGLRGTPTQYLATFDPAASPAQMVAASPISGAEACARFLASTAAFVEALEALDDDGWRTLAETPPGHLTISALAHHALWDSWVHERDILLPLGSTSDVEPDEVAASLRYVAALGPALALNSGTVGRGTLTVDVADPTLAITVRIGDRVTVADGTDTAAGDDPLCLTGDAVDLLEMLSIRRPFAAAIPEQHAWMLRGLSAAFDDPLG
ncbi:MAG: hypothetical protein RJA49_966 [Actinomycetota bacterium]